MRVEGRGEVAPKPVAVWLELHEVRILAEEARKREGFRDYKGREDAWGKGMIPPRAFDDIGLIPQSVMGPFVGFLSEWAFAKWMNRQLHEEIFCVDLRRHFMGDGGIDFEAFGLSSQIKARSSRHDSSLVRRISERNGWMSLKSDVFVFAEFAEPWEVLLLGWCWTKHIESLPMKKFKQGHSNSFVEDHSLEPMSRLICEYEQRRRRRFPWH